MGKVLAKSGQFQAQLPSLGDSRVYQAGYLAGGDQAIPDEWVRFHSPGRLKL